MESRYGYFCRPGLVPMLEAIGLAVTYERAEGDFLLRRHGNKLVPVLDLVGGYGANLFGHHHPELVAAAKRLFDEKAPILAQASCRDGAARLAEALCRRLGDYVVTFTNSGAETIEAAVKHCLLERPKPLFWAVKGAFHGKTLGAIQFTWSYRDAFPNCGPAVRFLDPTAPESWAEALKEVDQVSAVFIEPIAGEGGVRPLPPAFVSWLANVCRENDLPLVADEIQSGMGRTGTFLAVESMGISPDYICLSKALGGGLAKIGALLVRRERYVEEFSVKQTSTFAEDDFSCRIALEALGILERDKLPERCSAAGAFLLKELEGLRRLFPGQIKEVRGMGLMVGLELQDQSHSHSYGLRVCSEQNYLGYLAASYLLNTHHLRLAPTLSQPLTLRLEPSAYVKIQELGRVIDAVTLLCEALKAEDLGHLTRFQIGLPSGPVVDHSHLPRAYRQEPARTERRVAFLGHLLLDQHLTFCEPSLTNLADEEIQTYLDKTGRLMSPAIFDRINIRSRSGEEVYLNFIGLGLSSRQIVQAMKDADYHWILQRVEEAVALAREEGCQAIGFGGYTSIVSGNCLRIKTRGIALTTGNSLTVGMGFNAIEQATRERGIKLSEARLGIVGALGNIASTYAVMLAPRVAELVLVVRDAGSPRLEELREKIRKSGRSIPIKITDQIEDLADCAVIVAASNTPEPLIYPSDLADGPVVICDISLPPDVADEVKVQRPDVLVIQGGVVKLPCNEDFSVGALPLPKGHVLACMAETLLMGLAGDQFKGSMGPVMEEDVLKALSLAEKHGFALGDFNANLPVDNTMSLVHAQFQSDRKGQFGF